MNKLVKQFLLALLICVSLSGYALADTVTSGVNTIPNATDVVGLVRPGDPTHRKMQIQNAPCAFNIGGGLTSAGCALNTTFGFRVEPTTSATILASDCGKVVVMTNAGANSVALPPASSAGFTSQCAVDIEVAQGAGTATVTTSGGSVFPGGGTTETIVAATGYVDYSDGTNWQINWASSTAQIGNGATILVNKNATALPSALTGTLFLGGNADTTVSRIQLDAFGAQAFFTGVCYGGTNASPTAVTSGTQCSGYNFQAYNGTSVVLAGTIRGYVTENQSVGHAGSKIALATAANATSTPVDNLLVDQDGGIRIPATAASPGANGINATGTIEQNGVPVVLNTVTVNGHALSSNVTVTKSDLSLMTSATDLTLVKANGTSGGTQSTGIVVSSANEVSGAIDLVQTDRSGTTDTLASTDCGTTIPYTSSSPITITLPNSLVRGCAVEIIQAGTGQITFAAGSGATLNNAHSQTKTFGQYSRANVKVRSNAGGTSAVWNLAGDTGT